MDFFSTACGETVPLPMLVERRVERKHSSHWAKTRGVIVSRSSIAERMVNCSWIVRMGDGSVCHVSISMLSPFDAIPIRLRLRAR